jgi:hypothetical protein
VRGLLADANFVGQVERLVQILRSPAWVELWESYDLVVETFAGLSIDPEAKDREVWERCQAEGLILITGNRNADGPDSLEMVIRDGPEDALPVFTIADGGRIMSDFAFAQVVASALMDAIDDLTCRPETILGAGRVYLPRNIRRPK